MTYRFDTVYRVSVNDDLGSATYWNLRFQDIDLRINAIESQSAIFDDAVASVTALGLNRINATIQPVIDSAKAQINTLTVEVTNLQNLVITDQTSVIGQLNTLLTTAQGLVANLQSLGTLSDGTF